MLFKSRCGLDPEMAFFFFFLRFCLLSGCLSFIIQGCLQCLKLTPLWKFHEELFKCNAIWLFIFKNEAECEQSFIIIFSVIHIATESILVFTEMKYTEVPYKCGLCTSYVENYLNLFTPVGYIVFLGLCEFVTDICVEVLINILYIIPFFILNLVKYF